MYGEGKSMPEITEMLNHNQRVSELLLSFHPVPEAGRRGPGTAGSSPLITVPAVGEECLPETQRNFQPGNTSLEPQMPTIIISHIDKSLVWFAESILEHSIIGNVIWGAGLGGAAGK